MVTAGDNRVTSKYEHLSFTLVEFEIPNVAIHACRQPM